MTAQQADTVDVAGTGAVFASIGMKVADWLGLADFNSIIIGVTGVLGVIYMTYKIKMIRLEYREKTKFKKRKSNGRKSD